MRFAGDVFWADRLAEIKKQNPRFEYIITLSRQHNDANVLSLGARFVSEAEAELL